MCNLERRSSAAIRYTDRIRDCQVGCITVVCGFSQYKYVKPAVRASYYR
jgi:hypothetical protein